MTILKEIAGYTFDKPSLLDEALTHPSLSGHKNYQRLEFLGDRVLGLIVSSWLLDEFPSESEGTLNGRFTSLVRKETLAEIARESGLDKLIKMTQGADTEGARDKDAVQADVVEAVLGAMFLDSGLGAPKAFITKYFAIRLQQGVGAGKDYKSQLQEWAQTRGIALPKYEMVGRVGPDHSPIFKINVEVDDNGTATATGNNKRAAEQAAAQSLLQTLTAK